MSEPLCKAVNPKTGRRYWKHKIETSVSVSSYSGSFASGMRPASYSVRGRCAREGCGHTFTGGY